MRLTMRPEMTNDKPYICMRCGRAFSKDDMEVLMGIRCPYCNYRIIMKARSPAAKRILSV